MGSLLFLSSIYLSISILLAPKAESLDIKSATTLDSLIRDYTLKSYNSNNSFKTGKLYNIALPENLSGVAADAIRLRCGSLQRYGARIKEFRLSSGVNAQPCLERVILVRQSVGSNWTSLYYNGYSTYRLITPILSLSAYSGNFSSSSSLRAPSRKNPITVDFSNTAPLVNRSKSSPSPICASFGEDGRVRVLVQERERVCVAAGEGRWFGLVEEEVGGMVAAPLKGKVSKGKIVAVSSIAAALGAFLLSLLMVAMLVNAKKKARMDEMERRAYEEEALQVSMVGHVRAVTASGTRTAPTIEHYDYRVRHS